MPHERAQAEKIRKRVVIIPSDVEIFRLLHGFRLLRIHQLARLTNRKYQQMAARLQDLGQAGYVASLRFPQQKHIFYLRTPALDVLLREGLITDEDAHRRVREGDLKSIQHLDHEMMISDLHALLILATRADSRYQLLDWREGKEIHHSFTAAISGVPQEVRLEPDAFFTLRDTTLPEGKNTRSFFLEADRGTMPKRERPGSRRFNDKIVKYEHYAKAERFRVHFKDLPLPTIRILTLTLTRGRRDSLVQSAADIAAEFFYQYFYFGSLEDLSVDTPLSVFDPVFIYLKDRHKPHSIL